MPTSCTFSQPLWLILSDGLVEYGCSQRCLRVGGRQLPTRLRSRQQRAPSAGRAVTAEEMHPAMKEGGALMSAKSTHLFRRLVFMLALLVCLVLSTWSVSPPVQAAPTRESAKP